MTLGTDASVYGKSMQHTLMQVAEHIQRDFQVTNITDSVIASYVNTT